MPSTMHALADLEHSVLPAGSVGLGLDRLRLAPVALVPEIKLYLAEDAIVWWARMEAKAGTRLVTPYWASAWVGGQALARYILDHPEVAAGKHVLDLASGSGLVAIAAGMAGASKVTANDIDPYAIAAVELNARENGVSIDGHIGDILDGDGGDAELLLVGDVLYDAQVADRVVPFLHRFAARGAEVLVGDPGRGHLPDAGLERLATYRTNGTGTFSDAAVEKVDVYQVI